MFCEEPILSVWFLESGQLDGGDWVFGDYYFDFAFYAAGRDCLVFQTENFYITLGSDGVKIWRSKEELVTPDMELDNYNDWFGDNNDDDEDLNGGKEKRRYPVQTIEDLYFQREHILNVAEKGYGWQIQFDHFSMMLYPRNEKEQPWSSYYNFLPYRNLNHKLKRCQCGGEARLMIDQVEDCYICCASCFRSTYADYRLGAVVEQWNNDECPVEEDHTPFECFFMKKDKTIKDIFIPKEARHINPDHISCVSYDPIMQFDDMGFQLTHLFIPENRSVFHIIYQLSSFNPELWPARIGLKEGEDGFHFVSLCKEENHEVMTLTTGKRDVVIMALPHSVEIAIMERK